MAKTNRLALCVLLVFCIGCSMFQISIDSGEKKYLAARAELNLLLEQYIIIQDMVSDNDHAKIKQAFTTADVALDTWEAFLGKDYDYTADLQAWMDAKSIIINLMWRYADGS